MIEENYPRRRNGSEYYSKRKKPWSRILRVSAMLGIKTVINCTQIQKNLFARNKNNEEYYARDFQGNEMYRLQQGKFRLAKTSNGTERYPRDAKGNEYYLQWDGESLSLRKPNGEHYLAQNRKGF
ncbi:hypothetical protein TNCV_3096071 [Trichonephila clavipes]|nr:hypothetical protein TNCV_3096071 [Trichonephila clavipes]